MKILDYQKSFYYVATLFYNEKININGTIKLNLANFIEKYELVAYIHYLFYNNNEHPIFNGKKTKDITYDKLMNIIQYNIQKETFNNSDLIMFIDTIIMDLDLFNPITFYLNKILKDNRVTKLNNIKIRI